MIKLENNKLKKYLHNNKVKYYELKKNKDFVSATDYVIDGYVNGNKNKYDNSKVYYFNEKGDKIMANASGKEIIVQDEFDKLNPSERVFFWLYNTTNYYDELYGGKTYLDEVLCYLIAFCKKSATKYGSFSNSKKGEKDKELKVEDIINKDLDTYNDRYENFTFKDEKSFSYIKTQAQKILRNKQIISCTKELVKSTLDDPDYSRAKLIKAVEELAINSESDKVKLEAYKVMGNWLGIDKPTVQNNIQVVMNAIDNDLQRQGFTIDVSDFDLGDSQ